MNNYMYKTCVPVVVAAAIRLGCQARGLECAARQRLLGQRNAA